MLEYLYTDSLPIDADNVVEMYRTADQFGIERLKFICEGELLKLLDVDNAASYLCLADMYNSRAMRERCMNFVLANFNEVTKTSAFAEMAKSNVELVIEVLNRR
jgi:speckle-type POZ protein